MAEEEIRVELLNDFYRDSFGKVLIIIFSILFAIFCLGGISLYLYLNIPPPITFQVDNEWRIQPPVSIDQPYRTTPDLLQWLSSSLPRAFALDFLNYNAQLKTAAQFFTVPGWNVFLNQLKIYANKEQIQSQKLFVNAWPAGAPYVLNQGLLSGRYAWWVQIPITVSYANHNRTTTQSLTLQVLVVRVPTLNNLNGVGIENILVAKSGGQSQL